MVNFAQLKKNIKKDFSAFKHIKTAILGDSPTQLLHTALRGYGFEERLNLDIYEAEFQQAEREVQDTGSGLYAFDAAFTILFFSAEELWKKFAKLPLAERANFSVRQLHFFESLVQTIGHNSKAKIIFFNFCELADNVFGNFANKTPYSFTYQLRAINFGLMQMAQAHKHVFILDINALQNYTGYNGRINKTIYAGTGIITELEFTAAVAKNITQIILSATGRFNKCLIVDLDNTLWGGIIGDDGINGIQIGSLGIGKAFTELQLWIKQLKERGIILAVCSKNDEDIAKEVFEKHPEMELGLDDIAVFAINWNNKPDNIRHIQQVLNIGFDSMVFIDDNPFERNMVRKELPEVTVPELPEDPAMYLTYLQQQNLFETASFTEEDMRRNEQYKKEAERVETKQKYTNEDDYLASLDMQVTTGRFEAFNVPRLAQLSQRSNQFNLRTVRYTEKDIEAIAADGDYKVFDFSLKDTFGSYGLVCMVILKRNGDAFFIENWLMSCRVLKRTLENFVLNTLAAEATKAGAAKLTGEYIPTAKNNMVKSFYPSLGFTHTGENTWQLPLDGFTHLKTHIK